MLRMSCNLGTEKMPIILDQQEIDSNSVSQGVFSTIQEQVLDESDFNSHTLTNKNYKNASLELNNGQVSVSIVKSTSKNRKILGRNSKKYSSDEVSPQFLYSSDELINYTNDEHTQDKKDMENEIKGENKKFKKKARQKVSTEYTSLAGSQSSDKINGNKPLKENQTGIKKPFKGREKFIVPKKCYKLIAPHPNGCEGQEIEKSIPKVANQHLNTVTNSPKVIKEIEDQRLKPNDEIHKGIKLYEYQNYNCNDKRSADFYIQPHFLSEFENYDGESKTNDLKNKNELEPKLKYFRCFNCSFMTLSADTFNYHIQKMDKCLLNNETFYCPGCRNFFYSLTPFKVHLLHDHKMSPKEAKLMLQSIQESNCFYSREKSSCAFEPTNQMFSTGGLFSQGIGSPEITIEIVGNRESMGKSDFVQIPNGRTLSGGRELVPCVNNKRQTMLESYLDDLNSKGDCSLPPNLTQNGSDLLENTFNFTAPVSEQLPSIQPPPAHSSSNPMIEHGGHLVVNQQTNHNFVGLGNVFSDHRVESYKTGENSHYDGNSALILTHGGYVPQQIHDIPVINLGENHFAKEPENVLPEEIAIDDFPPYEDNDLSSLDENESGGPLTIDEDQEDQEEKKKLKKLGVGYRCDINGCKVRLQSEKNIQYHRRCHEGTLYNCPECCKDCSTWVSLSSHLWQAHKIDMELYKCDQCPYKTPSYSRLTNIHRGIHGKARPFLCDVCGKGFKTVKQMRNHKNIHKAKMVRMSGCRCEICGRTVADKRQLELHINSTHKKKKPYLCYICGYATAVKHSLVVHIRRHTGEKPYECEKCDYKSADHNALRRHKMKHTGVKNYKCNHCSYTCIQASTYKVHLKTKHPGLETDVIFGCGKCSFQTLNRGAFLSHTSEHENYNVQNKKQVKNHTSKTSAISGNEYYGESNRMDLVGSIITENVVETIVDLSGAQNLLEDDYYEKITGDLEDNHELK